jgi:hypothetical protein
VPYTNGSHQIILGFTLGNRYIDACSRKVWHQVFPIPNKKASGQEAFQYLLISSG